MPQTSTGWAEQFQASTGGLNSADVWAEQFEEQAQSHNWAEEYFKDSTQLHMQKTADRAAYDFVPNNPYLSHEVSKTLWTRGRACC